MVKEIKSEVRKRIHVIIPVSLVVIVVASYFIFPGFQYDVKEAFDVLTSEDEELIEAWVAQFGFLGPLVIILAMTVQMFMFVVPNVLLMMIAIISYGPFWGSVISLAGVFTASSLGYFIGCKLSPVTMERFVSEKNQRKISEFLHDYGIGAIIVTRLFSFSNDALSFVAGILQMKYHRYILATLAGITPLVATLAIFGENGEMKKGLLIVASAAVVMYGVYVFVDYRKKRRRKSVSSKR